MKYNKTSLCNYFKFTKDFLFYKRLITQILPSINMVKLMHTVKHNLITDVNKLYKNIPLKHFKLYLLKSLFNKTFQKHMVWVKDEK